MSELIFAVKTMWGAVVEDALGLLLILFAIAALRCVSAHFGKE